MKDTKVLINSDTTIPAAQVLRLTFKLIHELHKRSRTNLIANGLFIAMCEKDAQPIAVFNLLQEMILDNRAITVNTIGEDLVAEIEALPDTLSDFQREYHSRKIAVLDGALHLRYSPNQNNDDTKNLTEGETPKSENETL